MNDLDPKLFVAAFPEIEKNRILYVLRDPIDCSCCGQNVKLVVEVDGAPPTICVACDEMERFNPNPKD